MKNKIKKIVCIGGGTGVSMVLSGLKNYPLELSGVVTMFDSGGSSGLLRKEFNILPPGDLRMSLFSTSKNEKLVRLLSFRFKKGSFKGHNLGNLLFVAAEDETGDFNKAVNELSDILNTTAKVLPVTLQNAKIKALLKNNKLICEEENIINCKLSKVGIKRLFLSPKVKANPEALSVIKESDLIIIGPGKLYTSVIPNLLVKGISEAIRKSKGKKVFICNLMTQEGNTDNFSVEDFVKTIEKYLGEEVLDYVIFNTGKLKQNLLKKIKKFSPRAEFVSYNRQLFKNKNFIGKNLLDNRIRKLNPADTLVKGANQRTIVFHDSDKLAKILFKLV